MGAERSSRRPSCRRIIGRNQESLQEKGEGRHCLVGYRLREGGGREGGRDEMRYED